MLVLHTIYNILHKIVNQVLKYKAIARKPYNWDRNCLKYHNGKLLLDYPYLGSNQNMNNAIIKKVLWMKSPLKICIQSL